MGAVQSGVGVIWRRRLWRAWWALVNQSFNQSKYCISPPTRHGQRRL